MTTSYQPVTGRFHPLDNMVANGMTTFEQARKNWLSGKYTDAINPFSLRNVKYLSDSQFIYICPDNNNSDMPVIRIDLTQLVTFPRDEATQQRFAKWFYNCLRKGIRYPFYEAYQPNHPTVISTKPSTQTSTIPSVPRITNLTGMGLLRESRRRITNIAKARRILSQYFRAGGL